MPVAHLPQSDRPGEPKSTSQIFDAENSAGTQCHSNDIVENPIDQPPAQALPNPFPIDYRSLGRYLVSTTRAAKSIGSTKDLGVTMHHNQETPKRMSQKAVQEKDVYRISNLSDTTTLTVNSIPKRGLPREPAQNDNVIAQCQLSATNSRAPLGVLLCLTRYCTATED